MIDVIWDIEVQESGSGSKPTSRNMLESATGYWKHQQLPPNKKHFKLKTKKKSIHDVLFPKIPEYKPTNPTILPPNMMFPPSFPSFPRFGGDPQPWSPPQPATLLQ